MWFVIHITRSNICASRIFFSFLLCLFSAIFATMGHWLWRPQWPFWLQPDKHWTQWIAFFGAVAFHFLIDFFWGSCSALFSCPSAKHLRQWSAMILNFFKVYTSPLAVDIPPVDDAFALSTTRGGEVCRLMWSPKRWLATTILLFGMLNVELIFVL